MKRLTLILLVLAVASLACSKTTTSTSTGAAAVATAEPTLTDARGAGEDLAPTADQVQHQVQACAVVIADEALHLRNGAGASAEVIGYLKHGDQVRVIDASDADWWLVDSAGQQGFVRSSFLERAECE